MVVRKRKSRSSSSASAASSASRPTVALGYGRALLLLLCIFVLMLIVAAVCGGLASSMFPHGSRNGILAVNIVQNLVAFFGSALLASFFVSPKPFAFMGCLAPLRLYTVGNILICFILGFPFLNEVVWLNSQMQLPSWLSGLEQWMITTEKGATAQVATLLGVSSVGGLLVNLLVIGVMTGICEEIFFRGTLQRLLASHGANKHFAIWADAFIFSLLHFQFFGFVPRLLLGAFFGYIFLWTGSIWASAAAHAIFNSITVVEVWLLHRGVAADVVESFGVQTSGVPWIACVSLLLVAVYIFMQRRYSRF